MGLRTRLSLLLTALLFAALVAASAYSLSNARRAVLDELRASTELASTLVRGLLAASPDNAEAIATLVGDLAGQEGTRHLRMSVEPAPAGTPEARPARAARVPGWFSELVRPAPGALTRRVPLGPAGGAAQQAIVIAADPTAEIEEAWRETRAALAVLLGAFVGANVLVVAFVGRALRPLADVTRALADVEHGDYAARVPRAGLPDVDRIAERFNLMAETLENSRAENTMLAQRSLAMQEDERRHLARELHDEMGQSITAIRALAASVRARTRDTDTVAADSASTIVDVSGDVYERVRRMMTRLHPAILDELGLVAAVERMVDDWNDRHEDCFCRLEVAPRLPELDGDARIAVYRIVQECLTNVARHAEASDVRVVLDMEAGNGSAACLTGEVSDNGRGFDAAERGRGLGLVGIAERVGSLGGTLSIEASPGHGTRVAFRAPVGGAGQADRGTDGGRRQQG